MIYKRIIDFGNKKIFGLDFDNKIISIYNTNIDIDNNFKLEYLGKDNYFYGYIIDLLVLYKNNKHINYNYFIIDTFENELIVFNKSLLNDFILKYVSINKNRDLYIDILFSNIKNYYLSNSIQDISINLNLNKLINNSFIKISKLNGDIRSEKIKHNISLDKHLLKFNKNYLYKNNIKIKFKKLSKLIGDFGFINYISHYNINKINVDLFLLNPVNIDGLNYKSIITKGTDIDSKLSIIKGFSEGIERYSSLKLQNDNFHKTSNFNLINDFSYNYIGYNIDNNEYIDKLNGFPVYKINKITNNNIMLDEKNILSIPIDFIYSSNDFKSIKKFIGNSNGISTHGNYYDAFLNSYYELLERDSIALTYFYKLSPNIVEIDDIYYKNKIANLEKKYCYNFTFLNLNFDYGINIILCIGINNKKEIPYLFTGAGADLDFKKAFNKSLNEVLYLVDLSNKNDYSKIIYNKNEKLRNLDIFDTKDHIYYYSLVESYFDIEFLFFNKDKIKFSKFSNFKNKNLIRNINNSDFYISNLTTSFGKNNNFFTIKLFSKKYIPFWFGKLSELPLLKLENRFVELKETLSKKNIFTESNFIKYRSKNKDFLHFLG
ncbi:MAG: YcaO-like family protein [Candidatus Gracilibacteria bacterium]|nr:YcaO-like family protein [Candidatus Gracilibacteria bacterium]